MKLCSIKKEKDMLETNAKMTANAKEELLQENNALSEKIATLQSSLFQTHKLLEGEREEHFAKVSQNSLLIKEVENLNCQLQCVSQELEVIYITN